MGGFRSGRSRVGAGTLGLGDALRIDGFLPHDQALAAMSAADALLLLVPRAGRPGLRVLSGKLFEYLAAERPVLALVPPEGDRRHAATPLDPVRARGPTRDDVGAIRQQLEELSRDWQARRAAPRIAAGSA